MLIKRTCIVIKLLETPEKTITKMQCLTGEVAVRVKMKVTLPYSYDLSHDYYMFLHKHRTFSAVVFLFLPLVLSLLCVYYIRLLRKPRRDFGLRTSDFGLRTSDFRLPTSDFRLPTSDFRLISLL